MSRRLRYPRRKRPDVEYTAYLQSDAWQEVRRRYQTSGLPWECAVCGTKVGLHLHHRTYKRLGNELLTDLVPLCKAHHEQTHERVSAGARLWSAHTKIIPKVTVVPEAKPGSGAPRQNHPKRVRQKDQKQYPKTQKITFESRTSVCRKCGTTFPPRYPKLRCWCGGFIGYQDRSKA